MLNLNRPETAFAINVVRQASLLVKQVQKELVSVALTKDDRSPVTVADFASQALVAKALGETFPNLPLVGEEDASDLRQPAGQATLDQVTKFVSRYASQSTPEQVCNWVDYGAGEPGARFWTLDPIDGTKGFLRGDQYAVALALIEDGQVEIGVLGCPNLAEGYQTDPEGKGTLAVAVRGEGAWITSLEGEDDPLQQLHVSDTATADQARLLRSFESGHTNISQIDYFAQELGIAVEPVRMDSQAKYILLARGNGELYLRLLSPKKPDYREKIWDQAAGSLIVQEAGGKVSDLHGKNLDFTAGRMLLNNRGILASNGQLHEEALQGLQAIKA
ncbi:MAG: 3'(2'),5'-bisphosphate nucleotidase [Chloroflexota bacterium]|nr:MAG: 3'(2'),5'-bisphosphate nucleotidase [Chloroflexota bacterium]